jgi:hypothetical protein
MTTTGRGSGDWDLLGSAVIHGSLDVASGAIMLGGPDSTLGFYGADPVVQQALASGATLADVIAALQALGLVTAPEVAGIRGVHGPQSASSALPGYPASFDGTIGSGGTYATVAAAASGAAPGAVLLILPGTYTSPAPATVKAGQEYWGDPAGVTLSFAAGTASMFTDGGSAKAGVKIVNVTFVGFVAPIDCSASGGWEVAYCDMSAENAASGIGGLVRAYQQHATPGVWVHHSTFHDSVNPLKLQDSTSGVLVEDCEFYNITGSDSFKPCLGTTGVTFRHCYIHDMDAAHSARGLWFDFHNQSGLIEWCDISGCDVGIEFEANPGSVMGMPGNVARYNYVHGCNHHGIRLMGSSDHQVYGNLVGPNQQAAQVGLQDCELFLYIDATHINSQGSDLRGNLLKNNIVTTPTSGTNKRASALQVQSGAGQPDPTPYVNNSKGNIFLGNSYFLGTLLAANVFYWNANKTWTTWQAIPQDSGGSAAA